VEDLNELHLYKPLIRLEEDDSIEQTAQTMRLRLSPCLHSLKASIPCFYSESTPKFECRAPFH
jgi:hypothetical protein